MQSSVLQNKLIDLNVDNNGMLSDLSSDYTEFCHYLESSCGITLGNNKSYLVECRLKSLMKEYSIKGLKDLVVLLRQGTNRLLEKRVIDAMTTNETSWFRDEYPFEFLKSTILPQRQKNAKKTFRIWSAACSYGHEPYSISIILQEFQERNPGCFNSGVEILGTDISSRALDYSTLAVYNDIDTRRGLSSDRRNKYFSEVSEGIKAKEKIKQYVTFRKLNLIQGSYPFGKFDVVFCRNVLIYFANQKKIEILENLARTLVPGGYLFLGASEPMASYSSKFLMIPCDKGVVYQLKG